MRVYINNRNYLTWTRQSAEWFARQGHEVILIDNASDYEPLLDWYPRCGYQLYRLRDNLGKNAPWLAGIVRHDDYYAVTDPDLSYEGIPEDWDRVCIDGFRHGAELKVGLSLDETRIPASNPAWILDEFWRYPQGDHPARWGDTLRVGRYLRYPIDTTLAVYRPGGSFGIGGWRTNRPYTARHLPWHLVLEPDPTSSAYQIPLTDEIFHYFTTASAVSESTPRMTQMLRAYAAKTGKMALAQS
jgi:hypothetical protein